MAFDAYMPVMLRHGDPRCLVALYLERGGRAPRENEAGHGRRARLHHSAMIGGPARPPGLLHSDSPRPAEREELEPR